LHSLNALRIGDNLTLSLQMFQPAIVLNMLKTLAMLRQRLKRWACQPFAKEALTYKRRWKKGGEATSASHDKEFYQEIGSKGGQNSGGNFANDREKASEAGRKGGESSHGGGRNS
jgi:general stress protein YciG